MSNKQNDQINDNFMDNATDLFNDLMNTPFNGFSMRTENSFIDFLSDKFSLSKYAGWTQWNELNASEKREFMRFFFLNFERLLLKGDMIDCERHGESRAVRGQCRYCDSIEYGKIL